MTEVPRRRRQSEIGDTGTSVFSGILHSTEYNVEWQVPVRYQLIDQMRSDPTIAAALKAIKLPLMRAQYSVAPVSDSPADTEQAEWLEDCFFERIYGTFADFQRHAFMALDYGSYPFETVLHYNEKTQKIEPRKLAPRHPASIYEWHLTPNSELDYVVQTLKAKDTGEQAKIPASRLLVFVNEQEGADFYGRSMLRPVYKPYWYKSGMEAVDAVAKEKRASGIDIFEMTDSASDEDEELAQQALATIRTHQHNFLTYPISRMQYKLEGIGAGSVLSTMETIEYHDLRILRAFFVEFLAMGPSGSGGLAQHSDKTQLMLLLDEAIGAMFLDTVNTSLIPRLIDYNFGPQEHYPKLIHGKLDVRDLGALADGLFKLTQAGFLHVRPDGADEDFIRSMYDMPEAPEPGTYPVLPPPQQGGPGTGAPGTQPAGSAPASGQPEAPIDGGLEPPDYLSAVTARQLASLRALAKRATDVNDLVSLSVPFKAEAALLIARGSTDPEVLIKSRSQAEVYAGQLKSQVVREWRRYAPTTAAVQ